MDAAFFTDAKHVKRFKVATLTDCVVIRFAVTDCQIAAPFSVCHKCPLVIIYSAPLQPTELFTAGYLSDTPSTAWNSHSLLAKIPSVPVAVLPEEKNDGWQCFPGFSFATRHIENVAAIAVLTAILRLSGNPILDPHPLWTRSTSCGLGERERSNMRIHNFLNSISSFVVI